MAATTRSFSHPPWRVEAAAPAIPGGFVGSAGSVVSLLVACYGRGLFARLFRSLLAVPQAAWMSCNGSRSKNTIAS